MARSSVIRQILRNLPGRIEAEVIPALKAAGDLIAAEAHVSITAGSVSGKNHVPSDPGQPPNNDTRVLVDSIEVIPTGGLKVEISANAPYAAHLEFGTSRMAARPYMAPAAHKMRPEANALVRRAVDRAVNRVVREARNGRR